MARVDGLAGAPANLAAAGIVCGEAGPAVCNLHDPDGYRIELVQWPPGHLDGMDQRRLPLARS